jgi:hypothetical protein
MQNEIVVESQENLQPTDTDTVENEEVQVETTQLEENQVENKDVQVDNEGEEQIAEKSFNQKQVNEMIKARLERSEKSFLKRYEVQNLNELNEAIGKSQAYDVIKERYDSIKAENSQLREKIAFLSNNINPDREEDIRAYFKGKEIEFNDDNFIKELGTHPEWLKIMKEDTTPKTTIKALGVEHTKVKVDETEDEKRKRIFGV